MSPFTLGNTEATRIVLESMTKLSTKTPQNQAVNQLGNGIVSSNLTPVSAVQNNPQTIRTQQVLQTLTNSSPKPNRGWTTNQLSKLKELGKRRIEVKKLLKDLDWECIAKSLNKDISEIKARLTDLNPKTITKVTSDINWTKDQDSKLKELVDKRLKLQNEWKDKLVWNKIAEVVKKKGDDCSRKFKSEFQNKKPTVQPSLDTQSISFEKSIVYASYQIISNSNKTSNNTPTPVHQTAEHSVHFVTSSSSSSATLPDVIDLTDGSEPPPKKAKTEEKSGQLEEKSDPLEKMRISYLLCEEKTHTENLEKLQKNIRKRKRETTKLPADIRFSQMHHSTESEDPEMDDLDDTSATETAMSICRLRGNTSTSQDPEDEDEINNPAPSLPHF